MNELEINLAFKEDPQAASAAFLKSWHDKIYDQFKSIGDIGIKNGEFFYKTFDNKEILLNIDDPESIGKIIIAVTARYILEGKNENR